MLTDYNYVTEHPIVAAHKLFRYSLFPTKAGEKSRITAWPYDRPTWASAAVLFVARGERGYFKLQRYYVKEWAENSMLHITVADAESCFEQITTLISSGRFPGARVSKPKQEQYGALVTYAWDPSGVLLHLAQWTDA